MCSGKFLRRLTFYNIKLPILNKLLRSLIFISPTSTQLQSSAKLSKPIINVI